MGKKLLEAIVSVVLHPVAVVFMIVNVLGRDDIGGFTKALWFIAIPLWGIGPLVYIFLGGGDLW